MENIARNMEKALRFLSSKATPGEAGYHTLMLLGKNGKIRKIKILKGLVTALVLAQILLLCAAAYFFFGGMKRIAENRSLLNALDVSQKNYLAMRDEKDMLTARLVLAESMVKGGGTGAYKPDSPADSPEKPLYQQNEPPRGRAAVSIDNFKVFHDSKTGALNIQFDLKNAGADIQYITGYAFVILKENNIDQNNWLSVPNVPLVSKRPSVIDKGRRFSISRFKQVFLTTNVKFPPQRFKTATVFAFSISGELLLEKDLPVEIITGGT